MATTSTAKRVGNALLSARARFQLANARKLHLGCGSHVLSGWANLDMEPRPGVIRCDLSRALPVSSGSIDRVFSEHFIEHLTLAQASRLVRECFRVLRPGGVIRLSTPDLKVLVRAYLQEELSSWSDMDWHPSSACRLLNEGMRAWGHQFVFDEPELRRMLQETGFHSIERVKWRESVNPDLRSLERRPDHGDLIIEAIR